MKLIRTVKCKLEVSPEEFSILRETLGQFADTCNYILQIAKENKIKNKIKLHHLCYRIARQKFDLSANLTVRAIARVANALKRKGRKPHFFQAYSVDYDQRIFSYNSKGEQISISTTGGRLKIKLDIGNYQRYLLKNQELKGGILFYRKSKKTFYFNILLSREVPKPRGSNPIGIDVGINNLATTSNGMRFSGKHAMDIRRQYSQIRSSIQSKGTRGSKKLLKRLSGKERRNMANINHTISRRLVGNLRAGDVVVMEDLTHIRNTTKQRKNKRYLHQSWPFRQLQSFIKYKTLDKNIPVVFINPKDTSHICPRCEQIGSRKKHLFSCSCGYRNHADFTASYNIARRGFALLAGLPVDKPLITAIQ